MRTFNIAFASSDIHTPHIQAIAQAKTSSTIALPIKLAATLSLCLGLMNQSAWAESSTQSGQKATDTVVSNQDPVKKPADGKGKLPTFSEADKNRDHSINKYELQNFSYMLQVFDKVDAGKDGKLGQHEYQNLEMETKREGEIS